MTKPFETLHFEVYKLAQQLLRLAAEYNHKGLASQAVKLGIFADKLERETRQTNGG